MKKLSKDHSLEGNSKVIHVPKISLSIPLIITLKEQELLNKSAMGMITMSIEQISH